MSALFSPLKLRDLSLANRVIISPMCQYSAERGEATDWHTIHLGHLALSGASMMLIEATAVEPIGRITPYCLGLWDERTERALAETLDAVRRYSDIRIGMQLNHAGRKASSDVPWRGGKRVPVSDGGWATVGASPVPFTPGDPESLELDVAGIVRIRNAFVAAAKRADRLGIEAFEIHGAHGYLIHQFLSPLSNQRSDTYGGSLENRMRFALEIFDAVRAAVPAHKPVGMRISATDYVEGGWDLEQSLVLANALKARGCDWIDCSSGGTSPLQKLVPGPNYQVPFAEAIRRDTGSTTIAVGLITEFAQAEQIIASGQADLVALARAVLYDARWPWHAAAALGAQVDAPPQYWRALPREAGAVFSDHIAGTR